MPNVPGGTPRARRPAPYRRSLRAHRQPPDRRPYTLHSALLVLTIFGALAGSRGLSQAGAPPAVLLPPDLRYTAALVLGTPGGQATTGTSAAADVAAGQAPTAEARLSVEAATPTPEPVVEQVLYLTHDVAEGETLTSIGGQYGIDAQYLVWNNPEVGADPDMLIPGETLVVPGTPGIVYDVRLGDTVTDIAVTYGIDPAAIVTFGPNDLASADLIVEGGRLVLPGGVPPPPPPPVIEETPAPVEPDPATPEPAPIAPAPRPLPPPVVAPAPPAPPPAAVSSGYAWPVNGTLNSRFGPRWGSFHSGIDIGAPYGTGVAAAASGQVVLASYSNYGYGNYVIVRHGDGSETLYAHLSATYVSLGQYVGQGGTVGAVGCTGWCTGNHLHFEVRIGGRAVDPLLYLP